jgi:RNA polymerase sigma factor (TIGR02999 family)
VEDGVDGIERLLAAVEAGDREAADALYGRVYAELRSLAHAQRRRWHGAATLGTTALVHEAYLKLAPRRSAFAGRVHFFATAARAMRHVLVSHARQVNAQKRGSGARALTVDVDELADAGTLQDVLAVHECLERLESLEPRCARVIECRVFGGLDVPETAHALGVSPATVKRDWAWATAWLYRELEGDGS